jgi:hypothetical protein
VGGVAQLAKSRKRRIRKGRIRGFIDFIAFSSPDRWVQWGVGEKMNHG